jgi:hypothetical protein
VAAVLVLPGGPAGGVRVTTVNLGPADIAIEAAADVEVVSATEAPG